MKHLLFLTVLILLQQFCLGEELVDTSNFYQLTSDERTLVNEYSAKIESANDSLKIALLNELYNEMNDNDVWVEYLRLMKKIIDKRSVKNQRFINSSLANFYNDYGYYYDYKGYLDSSLWNYQKSLQYSKMNNDTLSIVSTQRSIGAIYSFMGLYEQSLTILDSALSNARQVNDSSEMGYILLIMGKLNMNVQEEEKGLLLLYESLAIRRNIGEIRNSAINLNDIGTQLTYYPDSLKKGISFLRESARLSEEVRNYRQMAAAINNIGSNYFANEEYDSALVYQSKALEIMRKHNINHGLVTTISNVGKIYFELNDITQAKKYGTEAYRMALKTNKLDDFESAAAILYKVSKAEKNYKDALIYYEKYIESRDQINNESNQKATIRQQTKYEFEKEQLVKEQQLKEKSRKLKEATDRRNNIQYSLIFLGILLFFGVVLGLGFIKVPPNVAEGLIFFAFLILFEFLLVLADPYVESLTSGEPIYKLLANAILAGAIFPAHAFFERTLKKRIVKN